MEYFKNPDTSMYVNNSYKPLHNGHLMLLTGEAKNVPTLAQFVHSQFRAFALDYRFPCAGARAAIHRGTYRFGMYFEMDSVEATLALCRDLQAFVVECLKEEEEFTTFVASFIGPSVIDEERFEGRLWQQLQHLNEKDEVAWDRSVSSDPDNPYFAFSFAGCSFFVIGLHASSSRWARRFAWPTLIFNAHYQFERLREKGYFERFKQVVRNMDSDLQGNINPNLLIYSSLSAARQYSGRFVEENWLCPVHLAGSLHLTGEDEST